MTEGSLLCAFIGYVESVRGFEKGVSNIIIALNNAGIDVSESAIHNYEAGHGSLGVEGWIVLDATFNFPLLSAWLEAKTRKHFKEPE